MDNRAIGIFDSGVGGLTVFKEISKQLPNESYIYVGDTSRFPYGNKSKENIIEISRQIVEFLISLNVKMIVVACGTVTSQALEYLKTHYTIPIIGIIEPTVKQVALDKISRLGIIGTKGTIESGAWNNYILRENDNIKIYAKSTPLLAPMAEEGWTKNRIAQLTIKEYMKDFEDANIEKLILGCTHYVLFKDLLKEELENVELVDTGEEIAFFLYELLHKENCLGKLGKREIYLTDVNHNFLETAKQLLGYEIEINKVSF